MSDPAPPNLQGFLRKVQQRTAEPIAVPIAVIGMACRFPGAPDVEAFRRLLARGGSGITDVPADRWDVDRFYDPEPAAPGKMCSRRGGFVERLDEFAAEQFQISAAEAETMDPQQRLLLETVWAALEATGRDPRALRGSRTGVHLGLSTVDFTARAIRDDSHALSVTGVSPAVAAGRISYVFDLHGPCETIDTACSSSLVAVHNACRALRGGEAELAIAAGVNALLDPWLSIKFSQGGFLARDGRCKTFDARADGYVRGEGCGVVVLKRLADARRDGDRILGVIRGSAINHDGLTQGLTAPSGPAQQAVIRQALASAGVEPGEVDYFEAHGTGTPLGDPQELYALGSVVAGAPKPVLVASVKTNVGHLEAAAGVAGLIKVLLQIDDEVVYPHAHLADTNPDIALRELGLQIPTELVPWPAGPADGVRRRIAGISSFGFSGTNAHIVLEEPPAGDARSPRAASPATPLRRKRFPLTPRATATAAAPIAPRADHPWLGHRLAAAEPVVQFETAIDLDTAGLFADHRVRGQVVYPGAGFIELVLGGVREAFGAQPCQLEDVRFSAPLVVTRERRRLQLVLVPAASGRIDARIASRGAAAPWIVHASARVHLGEAPAARPDAPDARDALAALRAGFTSEHPAGDLYRRLADHGLVYGPAFRGLDRAWTAPDRPGEALARLAIPAAIRGAPGAVLHPVLLDAAWHAIAIATGGGGASLAVPAAISAITIAASVPGEAWVHVTHAPSSAGELPLVDLQLWTDAGDLVVDLAGLRLAPLPELPAPSSTASSTASAATAEPAFVRELKATSGDARRTLMLGFLRAQAAEILRVDPEDIEDLDVALFEIGMTSLMITELQYRIQKQLGFRLPARKGFEFDSPESLADFLLACALEAPPG
ncbi:MAG TPA: beta-ketoacyl synthase N-terminal-like domain-containing protein [Kofleriaceae bacterium]|nr:beta-ketoacyl synthase N-terminal-like domain-containing protein [Kofleriaceae bacterium]